MLTFIRRSTWLLLAVCLSMAALAGCGSDAPAADTPAASTEAPQVDTPAPAAAADTQAPAPTVAPTSPPAQAAVETGHKKGQMAPDFMLTTVDGEEVSLDGFQGQPLVIYFYATW